MGASMSKASPMPSFSRMERSNPGVFHIHQTGAGDIGGLAEGLAGETEADVVLYGEDVLNVVIDLGQVVLEPGQQSGLLARPMNSWHSWGCSA